MKLSLFQSGQKKKKKMQTYEHMHAIIDLDLLCDLVSENNVCDYCSNRVLLSQKVSFKFRLVPSHSDYGYIQQKKEHTKSVCECEGRDMAIKYATVQFFSFPFSFCYAVMLETVRGG